MNEQLRFTHDNRILGDHERKVELAIQRLQAFEPKDEPYWLAFSGGKDSQCIYHLCKMAGVKFEAAYAVTSVDMPELIYFIREHYPDVKWVRQYYDDNIPRHYFRDGRPKPKTMFSLIADHTLPPTRKVRYCCASLKEPGGQDESLLPASVGLRATIERKLTELLIYKVNQSQQSNLQTN